MQCFSNFHSWGCQSNIRRGYSTDRGWQLIKKNARKKLKQLCLCFYRFKTLHLLPCNILGTIFLYFQAKTNESKINLIAAFFLWLAIKKKTDDLGQEMNFLLLVLVIRDAINSNKSITMRNFESPFRYIYAIIRFSTQLFFCSKQ